MTGSIPATQRQLRYLRALAERTASTFTPPRSRGEASREIQRLRGMPTEPRPPRLIDPPELESHLTYAPEVQPEEIEGYGSSATWRVSAPPTATVPASARELASYALGAEERVLASEPVGPEIRIVDRPRSGPGLTYLVEREPAHYEECELEALLDDYLSQASQLERVPMAGAAIEQILGGRGGNA